MLNILGMILLFNFGIDAFSIVTNLFYISILLLIFLSSLCGGISLHMHSNKLLGDILIVISSFVALVLHLFMVVKIISLVL